MSAENSRLVRSIRRIAREPADQSGSVNPGRPRGDQPGGQGVGESDAERDRVCCDGTVSGDANTGASGRDTSRGGQDGLNADDPADIGDAGPGELSGVVDCATGELVCLDGADFIPPDGWDDAQSPGPDPTYAEGFYWMGVAGGCTTGTTVSGSTHPTLSGSLSLWSAIVGEALSTFGASSCGGGALRVGVAENFIRGRIQQYACSPGSNLPACSPDPQQYQSEEWPSDGCVNLAIKGGKIVGSKYDPENDGSYSAPRDEIELCDPENGTSILLRASPTGGWKSIKSLDGDIDPDTGYGYLYRPNGQRVRQISPSEFRDDTV